MITQRNYRALKQIDIQHRIFKMQGSDTKYFCTDTKVDYNLDVMGVYYVPLVDGNIPANWANRNMWQYLPFQELSRISNVYGGGSSLSGDYVPASDIPYAYNMHLVTPDAMDKYMHEALRQLKQAVGNVQEFVASKLHYSIYELSQVLSNEQIDGVALAIYNAEVRNQGMIIGDQTGVGKGRMAAAFIRYAVEQGLKPVFFTKTDELFPDIIRDLTAIHCKYKGFTTNSGADDVLDDDGNILVKYNKKVLDEAMQLRDIPDGYHYMLCTYSQLSQSTKEKIDFIKDVCFNAIVIMDEAHLAGGEQGETYSKKDENGNIDMTTPKIKGAGSKQFTDFIVPNAKAVMYLSATFAKRPENMPVYAIKTCFMDSFKDDERDDIFRKVQSIFRVGGNAVEEIASNTLVEYGQMIRREHQADQVDNRFISLDEKGAKDYDGIQDCTALHTTLYNNVLSLIKRIRMFEMQYIQPFLQSKQANYKKAKIKIDITRRGLFARLFNIVDSVLFAIKADAVADRAIYYLKNGCKPVIAFSKTFEKLLPKDKLGKGDDEDTPIMPFGSNLENTDIIYKFDSVFKSLLKYKEVDHKESERIAKEEKKKVKVVRDCIIDWDEIGKWWQELNFGQYDAETDPRAVYEKIQDFIAHNKLGLTISPIDYIRYKIEKAGDGKKFTVAECTRRKRRIKFTSDTSATLEKADGESTTKCYNDFNNNEKDCLFINTSGSTGKSAHAIPTDKVPVSEVKRRVMIVAQAEPDINDEMQKRGRINRTGQLKHILPIIEYIFSFLPSEQKMMMRLKKKLKSLSANTSADQNADSEAIKADDIYNIYGDKAALDTFAELFNQDAISDLNMFMDNPLKAVRKGDEIVVNASINGFAQKAFSRFQILPLDAQDEFLTEFYYKYADNIEKAKEEQTYFLEADDRNYDAEVMVEYCMRDGNNAKSRFGAPTFMNLLSIKAQKKMPSYKDIVNNNLDDDLKDVLANIEKYYKEGLENIDWRYQNSKESRITSAQNSINQYNEAIAKYKQQISQLDVDDENILPLVTKFNDKITEAKEKIAAQEEKLKNIDSDIQKEKDADIKSHTDKKNVLVSLLNQFKVGSVFQSPTGNLWVVGTMRALFQEYIAKNEYDNDSGKYNEIDLLSAPANIKILIYTTDNTVGNFQLSFAGSEEARSKLNEILGYKKLSGDDWDKFINSGKYRDKVYMITGNIIPYIKNDIKGVIVRYTNHDGSTSTGLQVKLEKGKDGRMHLPSVVNGISFPISDYPSAIINALNSEAEINISNAQIDHGKCTIWTARENDSVKYIISCDRAYVDPINKSLEYIKYSSGILTKWNQDGGYWTISFTEDEFRQVVENMGKNGFRATVPFPLLEQYGIDIKAEHYQMQDWKKLDWNRKSILPQPKNLLQLIELKTL